MTRPKITVKIQTSRSIQRRIGQYSGELRTADAAEFSGPSAAVFPEHVSTVYEYRVFTWSETHGVAGAFASFFRRCIGHGDTVAAMLPNIPAMTKLHFAVPCGCGV